MSPTYIFHRTITEEYRLKADSPQAARLFVEQGFDAVRPTLTINPYFELMGTIEDIPPADPSSYETLMEEQKGVVKMAETVLQNALNILAMYEAKASEEQLALLREEIGETDL